MKTFALILLSFTIAKSQSPIQGYDKSMAQHEMEKIRNERRAGTIFQAVGVVAITYTAISYTKYREISRDYRDRSTQVALQASGIFVLGTAIKINAGRSKRRKL